MNYRGSYRKLLANSKSAMMAAIEIYNKPRIDYREEVFVQLLINAWELLLKAMVSKSKRSIYYKKRKGEAYRTLSWSDAYNRARSTWPAEIPQNSVIRNLELVGLYRDNAVHFYNAKGFEVVVYSLAQTSISNYCDLLRAVFGQALTEDISWALLPLGTRAPIGPLAYLGGSRPEGAAGTDAVDEFLLAIRAAAAELTADGIDTGRLLTVFDVTLRSTKKIDQADIIVGVNAGAETEPFLVTKILDPNRSHPFRRREALEKIQERVQFRFNSYSFDAVAWQKGLRENKQFCWIDDISGLTKWSPDTVTLMSRLSEEEVNAAREAYSARRDVPLNQGAA